MRVEYKFDEKTVKILPEFVQNFFLEEWENLTSELYKAIDLLQNALKLKAPISKYLQEDLEFVLGKDFLSNGNVELDYFNNELKFNMMKDYVENLNKVQPDENNLSQSLRRILPFYKVAQINYTLEQLVNKFSKKKNAKKDSINVPVEAEKGNLGKWAFAEDRTDVPYEENTKTENSLESQIVSHLSGDGTLNKSAASKIVSYIEKGQYLPLLQFPTEKYETVFRGMRISTKEFNKLFGFIPKDRETKILDVDIWAKPRGATTSWTLSIEIAQYFANDTTPDESVAIIMAASTSVNSDKFILNPEKIYNVAKFASQKEQLETIGIGPIKIHKIAYANSADDASELLDKIVNSL